MDTRNGVIALAFAALAIATIAIVAFVATSYFQPPAVATTDGDDDPGRRRTKWPSRPVKSSPPRVAGAEDGIQIERLERLIERKNESIAQLRRLKEDRDADFEKLKRQYDDSLKLVAESLEPQADAASDSPAALAREKIVAEAARMRAELAEAKSREDKLQMEYDDLQLELAATELEIDALREEGQRRIDDLVLRQRTLQSAATSAVVEAGVFAVPTLIEMLADENPDVRIWAADSIAEIGPSARDATPALTRTADDDTDPRVRTAARAALAAMRD